MRLLTLSLLLTSAATTVLSQGGSNLENNSHSHLRKVRRNSSSSNSNNLSHHSIRSSSSSSSFQDGVLSEARSVLDGSHPALIPSYSNSHSSRDSLGLTTPDEDDINQTEHFQDTITPPSSTKTKRQSDAQQAEIIAQASTSPVAAAQLADQLPGIANNQQGNDQNAGDLIAGSGDATQYPWNAGTHFNPNPDAVPVDNYEGWQALPQAQGFTLNRTIQVAEGAIQVSNSGVDETSLALWILRVRFGEIVRIQSYHRKREDFEMRRS